jgi:hypothetical protein
MNRKEKRRDYAPFLLLVVSLAIMLGCGEMSALPAEQASAQPTERSTGSDGGTPRLALWLAKLDELTGRQDARYDLVMTGWFEQTQADVIRSRNPSAKILAGLSPTWIFNDPEWLRFLLTIANGGNPNGPLQITDDMYLMLDKNGDGKPDSKCSLPGWEHVYAMDPRHPGWRKLILAFYETVAKQAQHDGIIADMVDAYPFCEGAWSGGVTTPMNAATWVSAQDELQILIRQRVPADKWIIANAGHDFAQGSPFPRHLNGYLLENFLGSWGANLEEGLASAQRALTTTQVPHIVVFAVDTDDTGKIDWARLRVGLAASLLMDNTYFVFDYGSRDHGGVTNWWFPQYYTIDLGNPRADFTFADGVYRRDFDKGTVIIAVGRDTPVTFDVPYVDIASDKTGSQFVVPKGDAGIFLRAD